MDEHDTIYKLLFAHDRMIQDLLVGFLPDKWVAALDLESLEKTNGSYVTDDLRGRHGDAVWRIRWGEEWLYVYLLLEFQSSVDRFMALRIMVYTGLLHQDLIRLEHHRSSDEVAGLLQLLVKWLSGPEQAGLRRAYLEWLRRRLPKWFPGETFPEMHDLQEAYEMITNRFEEWKERQRLAGVAQGRLDGERTLVLRQVQHRFGTVPPTLRLRLQNASQTELEHLADRILDASSVDDLFQ